MSENRVYDKDWELEYVAREDMFEYSDLKIDEDGEQYLEQDAYDYYREYEEAMEVLYNLDQHLLQNASIPAEHEDFIEQHRHKVVEAVEQKIWEYIRDGSDITDIKDYIERDHFNDEIIQAAGMIKKGIEDVGYQKYHDQWMQFGFKW